MEIFYFHPNDFTKGKTMNKLNTKVTFKGNPLTLMGKEIHEGDTAPEVTLVGLDLKDLPLSNFKGKVLVISVVPSLDTPTCNLQTKRFNAEAAKLADKAVVLTVSLDLPFAQKRWCEAEKASNVLVASDYKYRTFGEAYGCYTKEMGLLARAIFVVGQDQKVRHVEYVANLSDEPDYNAALTCVSQLLG